MIRKAKALYYSLKNQAVQLNLFDSDRSCSHTFHLRTAIVSTRIYIIFSQYLSSLSLLYATHWVIKLKVSLFKLHLNRPMKICITNIRRHFHVDVDKRPFNSVYSFQCLHNIILYVRISLFLIPGSVNYSVQTLVIISKLISFIS